MLSTTALEPLGDLLRGPSGLPLFQLYLLKDRSLTEELIHRAEASGYQGLVITVDAPASGRREADIRNRFALASHVDLPHLNGRKPDDALAIDPVRDDEGFAAYLGAPGLAP